MAVVVVPDPCERRARIVASARGWIGTPYRHQASLRSAGADCLGLVRGVWREIVGPEPVTPPPYTRAWDECAREETLWRALDELLDPTPEALEGDILLFRMMDGAPAKHLAIRASDPGGRPTIIHAYSGRSVVETALTFGWRSRTVATFGFPVEN
ncbi:MAG: peptidase [Pikeienuella sp.]|uniref:peptidase n=1 Tax=Pikeienuella sp. TaxID=2831957 RepID=UPI00391D242E